MLNKYLNIWLKGYHTPWGANVFPQFSRYLGNKRNQIKKTQRDDQRSEKCQERGSWVFTYLLGLVRDCQPVSTGGDNKGTFTKAAREREQPYVNGKGASEKQRKWQLTSNVAVRSGEIRKSISIWQQKVISVTNEALSDSTVEPRDQLKKRHLCERRASSEALFSFPACSA